MKKLKTIAITLIVMLNVCVLMFLFVPLNANADIGGGNNVTCYQDLTIGDKNYSVYDCSDCKRSYCESYSNKSTCYYKDNDK